MGKGIPSTPAIRALKDAKAEFRLHQYKYVERGGTSASSAALNVEEHRVIKTLVLETAEKDGIVALMHGDSEVSLKSLARHLGTKAVQPCTPKEAQRRSGYQVGGTSPFGLRSPMAIYAQKSIFDIEKIFINAGKRGLLMEISTAELRRVLAPVLLEMRA